MRFTYRVEPLSCDKPVWLAVMEMMVMQSDKSDSQEITQEMVAAETHSAHSLRERIQALLADQRRNARWITAGVTMAAFVGVAFYLFLAFQSLAWQHFGLVGITSLLLIVGVTGMLLVRRGREQTAIWLMLIVGQVAIASSPLFTSGMGLWYAGGVMMATLIISTLTLPGQSSLRANMIGVVAGIAALLVDGFLTNFQLPSPKVLQYFVPAVFAFLAIIYLLILVVYFASFSLRSKVTVTMFSVAVILIVVISVVNNLITRQGLIQAVNQTLLVAANYTARNVDEYLLTQSNSVASDALQSPYLYEYFILSDAERATSLDASTYLLTLTARRDAFAYVLIDQGGRVVLHTQVRDLSTLPLYLGLSEEDQDSFRNTVLTGEPFFSAVVFPATGDPYYYIGQRIVDTAGTPVGVLLASFPLSPLQLLVSEAKGLAGEGSYGVILDDKYLRLADGLTNESLYKLLVPASAEIMESMRQLQQLPDRQAEELFTNLPDFSAGMDNLVGSPYFESQDAGTEEALNSMAAVRLENRNWFVVFVQPQSIILRPAVEQTRTTILVAAIIGGLTVAISAGLAQLLSGPILQLTEIAQQAAEGDLSMRAPEESADEIGTLSRAFNVMTGQLSQTLEGLEQRVAERTSELAQTSAQMEYRAQRLQKVADVAQRIAAEQDPDKLFPLTTQVISEEFGFYHVGIFLLDQDEEYAVLQAANSDGGQRMLRRGHRLKVGEVGIVGYVTDTGEARIALDVGKDAVFFDNPDLPNTRSEIALPLKIASRVIGALDVQSLEPGAFSEDDVALLSTLANQVALAIQNARLFGEAQATLRELQVAQRHYIRQEWERQVAEETRVAGLPGYRYQFGNLLPLEESISPVAIKGEGVEAGLVAPISLRGEVIGAIQLGGEEDERQWTEEEMLLVRSVADQVGLALENARLLDVTQRRAERERMVAEITTKLRATNDPQTILQAAVVELRHALRAKNVQVRIQPKDGGS